MSFKRTLLVTCDSPGCQASAQIEMDDEAKVNELLKANKWTTGPDIVEPAIPSQYHTCPWCVEAGISNGTKAET